jgi:hypothetical protein
MKFLPAINHHIVIISQKFNIYLSNTTAVIKNTIKTSIKTLTCINLFLQQNFKLKHVIL